jgi:hypothetical protein
MFSSGLVESRSDVISIREASKEAFEAVLRYIYCGNVDIEHVESYVVDVLIASTKFVKRKRKNNSLRTLCCDF